MLPPRPKGQGLRKPKKKDDLDHTKFWKARIKSFEALNQIIERIGREDLPDWMLEKYMEQPPKPGRR